MIDSPSGRVNMVPTEIATVGRTTGYSVMLGDTLAVLAEDTIGIEITLEPF